MNNKKPEHRVSANAPNMLSVAVAPSQCPDTALDVQFERIYLVPETEDGSDLMKLDEVPFRMPQAAVQWQTVS